MYKMQETEELGSTPVTSYVALPLDMLKSNNDNSLDGIQLIIKSMPPGTICLLETPNLISNDCLITDMNSFISQKKLPTNCEDAGDIGLPIATPDGDPSTSDPNVLPNLEGIEVVKPLKSSTRSPNRASCFSCIFCKEEFSKLSIYRKHMLWHRNSKKYKCDKCAAEFNVESNFQLHLAVHDSQKYRCPSCNIDFQRVASLKSHLLLHQVEEMYTCEECQAEFEKEEDLLKHNLSHMKDVKENEDMVCGYCKMPCEDVVSYKEHISLHVKVKKVMLKGKKPRKTQSNREYSHICKTCKKSFPKVSLLERHERIHSGEKPFVCHLCNKGFNQKGTLQVHLSKHSGIKPFACTLCPAKFNQRGNLRVHVEKTHMAAIPGEKTYRCPQCSCIFKKLGSLNGHMTKMHSNTHDEIDIVIKQLNELRQQAAGNQAAVDPVETDPPPEPPEEIGPTIPDQVMNEAEKEDGISSPSCSYVKLTESGVDGNLRRYLVKHRKAGDICYYMCNYCSKDFKKPSDLIRHIRVHTREKPYKCSKCSSAFSLKSTLIAHMNTHNTVKNIACTLCSKQFTSTRTHSIHMRKHQKGFTNKPLIQHYKCDICFKVFKNSEALEIHCQEHRNGDIRINHQDLMKEQPLVQTSEGLLPVAIPRSKLPYIDINEKKSIRPYQCQVCMAAFKKNVHLKRHMMAHNGEKRHKCPSCPKAFCTGSSLKEHMKFHTGIKNHGCKICGKKFVTSSLLKRHHLSHSSTKPYVCPHCDKRFKSVMVCRKHIKIHKKNLSEQQSSNVADSNQIREGILDVENIVTLPVSLQEQSFSLSNNELVNQDITQDEGISTLDSEKIRFLKTLKSQTNVLQTSGNTDVENNVLLADIASQHGVQQSEVISGADLVLTNSDNASQKIFINSSDIQLTENVNLQTICPQLKGTDSLFLSSLGDLQDPNILFNIDNLVEMGSSSAEMFTASVPEILAPHGTDKDPHLNSAQLTSPSTQKEAQGSSLQDNLLINGIDLYPNITFTTSATSTNSDLPLSVDILTEGSADLLGNSLNLSAGPMVGFQTGDLPNVDDGNVVDDMTELTSFLCTHCMEVYASLDIFKDHTCIVKDNSQSDTAQGISSVPSTDVPDIVLKCTVVPCNKTFQSVQELETHIKKSHNSKAKHGCKFCKKMFQKQSDLERHLRTHTGERPFACTLCEKKFSLKSTLETHYRVHNPSAKQYKCEVCNTFFTTKNTLKLHLYIHTGKKPYQCGFCPKKFRTLAHKKNHEVTKHDPDNPKKSTSKPKIMDILLASVSLDDDGQGNIILQSNTQNEPNPIERDQNNLYAQIQDLQVANSAQLTDVTGIQTESDLQSSDIIIPDDPLPTRNIFILEDGTLIMKGATNMVTEMMPEFLVSVPTQPLHNKEPPTPSKHECPICHKKYSSKVVLKKHSKTHQENKKFPCTKCSKGFDDKEDLDIHLKTHLGIRPYSCLYCNNSFAEEQNLKSHMKRLHGQALTHDLTWDHIDLV